MSNTAISKDQGGAVIRAASGGEIALEDGAVLTLGAIALTVSGANLVVTGLPTTDPEVVGALYLDTGVLTLSAGPT